MVTAKGGAGWNAPVTDKSRVYDLFGNEVRIEPAHDIAEIHITGAPLYLTHPGESVLAQACASQAKLEHERLARCVKAAEAQRHLESWRALVAQPGASGDTLRKALLAWSPPNTPITVVDQAIVAQALRWYWVVGRLPDTTTPPLAAEALSAKRKELRDALEDSVAHDADIPSLRYLLNRWEKLQDEEAVALGPTARSRLRRD